MAVVRCPNCGKPNPDFLEVCQYCEAPLHGAAGMDATPAGGGAPTVPLADGDTLLPPAQPAEAGEQRAPAAEPPDESAPLGWLERLRAKHAGDETPAARVGPAVEPDWMWTGQPGDQAPASPAGQADLGPGAADAAPQLPVWLRGLDLEDEPPAPPLAPTHGIGTRPLAGSRADEPPAGAGLASPEDIISPRPRKKMTDRLKPLGSAVPPAPEPPAEPNADVDLPDWLKAITGATPPAARSIEPPTPTQPPPPPHPIGGQASTPPAGSGDRPPPSAEEARPVALEPSTSEQPARPSPAEEALPLRPRRKMTDWLNALQSVPPSAPPAPSATPSAPAAPSAADDLPPWLKAISVPPPAGPSTPPGRPATAPLSETSPKVPDSAPVEPRAAAIPPSGSRPLSAPAAATPRPASPFETRSPQTPGQPSAAPQTAGPPAAAPTPESELPAWLKALRAQSAMAAPPAAGSVAPPGPTEPAAGTLAAGQRFQELPESMRSKSEAEAEANRLSAVIAQSSGSERAGPSAPGAAPTPQPLADDMPQWLRGILAAQSQPAGRETPAVPPVQATPAAPPGRATLDAIVRPTAPLSSRAHQAGPAPATPEPTGGSTAASETPAADYTLAPTPRRPRRMADWLGSAPVPPAAPTPAEDDLPEWLKKLSLPQAAPAPTAPAAKIDLPDWFDTIAPAPSAAAMPTPPAPAGTGPLPAGPAEELPDWIKSIAPSAAATPTPPAPAGTGPLPAGPAEELPNWMQSLAPSAATVQSTEAESPTSAGALQATPAEELPDWMKSLAPSAATVQSTEVEADTAALQAAPAQEMPDWMKSIAPSAATVQSTVVEADTAALQAAPAQEMPDWLKSIGPSAATAQTSQAATEAGAPAAEITDELPDWLKAIAQDSSTAAASARGSSELAQSEPAAAWSTGTWSAPADAGSENMAPSAPGAATPTAAPDEDVSDWLNALPASPDSSPAQPAAAQLPAWLQGVGSEAVPEIDPETLAWLGTAQGQSPDEATPSAEAAAIDDAGSKGPAAAGSAAPGQTAGEELPDWLRTMRGDAALENVEPDEMPDWLRALRGLPPRAKAPGAAAAAETSLVNGTSPAAPPSTPAPASLEQAALPSWLAAMRPVDIQRPEASDADSYQETLGVLAGMRGVLRAEPAVAQPHKATTPVQLLEVSDKHTAHANLLVELLHDAATLLPARRERARLSAMVERWLVFALLALAILLAQFRFANLFPLPAPSAADKLAFTLVDRLAPDKPALVAFDYEAAQQGELNPGAMAVVGHLLRRGVPVVALSTRLTGAAAGQALLDQSAALTKTPAGYGSLYINLGYVPGGPVGLLQFAAAPRSLFMNDFTGVFTSPSLWNTAPLAKVQKLSDFGLIVLVSGTPEATRLWIEQAESFAPGVPLLAVVSASAEPLVRPYLDTAGAPPGAALNGLVVGVAGAAQYEQLAGAPGAGAALWPALGGGLLAAALLIALGSLVYGMLGALSRRGRGQQPKA